MYGLEVDGDAFNFVEEILLDRLPYRSELGLLEVALPHSEF